MNDENAKPLPMAGYPLLVFLLVMVPWLLLLPGSHFTSDDFWFVGYGRMADDPATCSILSSFMGDWLHGQSGVGGWFRPLSRIHFYIDDLLWGLDRPWGYHLSNNLFHGLSAALVAMIFQLLMGHHGRSWRSLWHGGMGAVAAGLFFGFSPAAGGTAGWISARTDLLSTFFILLACMIVLLPMGVHRRALLASLSAILACLAKESGFIAPGFVILVLLARGDFRAKWKESLLLAAAVSTAALLVFFYRWWMLGGMGGYGGGFSFRRAIRWVMEYLVGVTWLPGFASLLVFLPIALAGWKWRKETPWCPLAIAGLGVGWLAVAGFVVFDLELFPVENGRYLYLSGVGVALILGAAATTITRLPRMLAVVQALLLAMLLGWFAVTMWKSASAWKGASRVTDQIVTELVEVFRETPPGRINIAVFRNMDMATYTTDALQTWRGGKVLPWDQAAFGVYRYTRGEVIARWGFAPDLVDETPRLALIGYRGDYDIDFFDTDKPIRAEISAGPDGVWRFPFSELAEISGHDGPFYAVTLVRFTAGHGWHPQVRRNGSRVTAPGYLPPGAEGTFVMNVGRFPDPSGDGWFFHPPGLDQGTIVHEVEALLFPLNEVSGSSNQSGDSQDE